MNFMMCQAEMISAHFTIESSFYSNVLASSGINLFCLWIFNANVGHKYDLYAMITLSHQMIQKTFKFKSLQDIRTTNKRKM